MDGRSRPAARVTRPDARHRRRPLAVAALAAIALNLVAAPAAAQEPGLTDGADGPAAAAETTILYPDEPTVVPTILDPTETDEPTVTPTIIDPTEPVVPSEPTETVVPTSTASLPPPAALPTVTIDAVLGQCSISGGDHSVRWFVSPSGTPTEVGVVETLQLGGVGAAYPITGDLHVGAQLRDVLMGEQYLPESIYGNASILMTIRFPSGSVIAYQDFELPPVCPFAVAERLCPSSDVRVGLINTSGAVVWFRVGNDLIAVPAHITDYHVVPNAGPVVEVFRAIGGEDEALVGSLMPEPVGDCGGPAPAPPPSAQPLPPSPSRTQPAGPPPSVPPAGPPIPEPTRSEPALPIPTATPTPTSTARPGPTTTDEAILIAESLIDPGSPWLEAFCLSIAGVSAAALAVLAWYLRRRPSPGDA